MVWNLLLFCVNEIKINSYSSISSHVLWSLANSNPFLHSQWYPEKSSIHICEQWWLPLHSLTEQFAGSSDQSSQSLIPSHFWDKSMHLMGNEFWHWCCVAVHIVVLETDFQMNNKIIFIRFKLKFKINPKAI